MAENQEAVKEQAKAEQAKAEEAKAEEVKAGENGTKEAVPESVSIGEANIANPGNTEALEDLLRQILEADKNEVKYAKRAAFFTCGLFLIFLVAAVIIVPKVVNTLQTVDAALITAVDTIDTANKTIDSVDKALASVDDTIDGINKMTSSITDTSENMNTMLTDNSQSLTEAVEKMNKIDFEGLNNAIQELQDAVGPFASFMNRFK